MIWADRERTPRQWKNSPLQGNHCLTQLISVLSCRLWRHVCGGLDCGGCGTAYCRCSDPNQKAMVPDCRVQAVRPVSCPTALHRLTNTHPPTPSSAAGRAFHACPLPASCVREEGYRPRVAIVCPPRHPSKREDAHWLPIPMSWVDCPRRRHYGILFPVMFWKCL